jgi:hypothetical protein
MRATIGRRAAVDREGLVDEEGFELGPVEQGAEDERDQSGRE